MPEEKVLLTLRYYATGSFLNAAANFMGIHKTTSGRIIVQVSNALAALRPRFISMPKTAEVRKSRQDFFALAKFPRCIGATDCTHIRIGSLGGDQAEIYRNRKNFFSLNVQTVCNAQLQITNIVARWPGSCHDSTIFGNSKLKQRCVNREFGDSVLIGDSGYPMEKYLITPLLNTQTEAEEVFNESIIRTRNAVERSYRVWKRRFPILSRGIHVKKVSTIQSIIVACAVLHNIAREFREQTPKVSRKMEREIQLTNFRNRLPGIEGGNLCSYRRPFLAYFDSLLRAHE